MKIKQTLLLAPTLWLLSSLLYAHTHLMGSNPSDGAVLKHAPTALALGFQEPVQLLTLELVDGAGAPLATNFKAAAASMKNFSIVLPELPDSRYKARWTALGKDGHQVEGTVSFTVDNNASEASGKPATSAEHHDHH